MTINGVVFNATEIKVLSELKLDAGTGDHEGTIDVDIDTIPGGHITLEYQGTATMTGATVVSAGTFETTKTTGTFDGLVAEGTYAMTIVESGDTLGAGVTVTDENHLAELEATQNHALHLGDMESMIATFYENVKVNLDDCTFEDKRLALAVLDVKMTANRAPPSAAVTSSSTRTSCRRVARQRKPRPRPGLLRSRMRWIRHSVTFTPRLGRSSGCRRHAGRPRSQPGGSFSLCLLPPTARGRQQ